MAILCGGRGSMFNSTLFVLRWSRKKPLLAVSESMRHRISLWWATLSEGACMTLQGVTARLLLLNRTIGNVSMVALNIRTVWNIRTRLAGAPLVGTWDGSMGELLLPRLALLLVCPSS